MDAIRQYLLSVTAAALLCAIVKAIIGKRETTGIISNVIVGLIMAVTILSGWRNLDIINNFDLDSLMDSDAYTAIESGQNMAAETLSASIKQQTESYILEKAKTLDLQIRVEVKMSNDQIPVPCYVTLTGSASPYAKKQMTNMIVNDLGITEENQKWT